MKGPAPVWILVLLTTVAFTLATLVQSRGLTWTQQPDSGGVLKVVLGDSRRLFANHFFVKADVYFHSGYYPSIFDQAHPVKNDQHLTSKEGSPEEEAHEKAMNFLGPPRDWVERFGRHFLITEHTHLEDGNQREILPWLRLSAELDPHRIETYTVSAFWLRTALGKVTEAAQFLREGLRNNPTSYELCFELGLLHNENLHDPDRARNLWELALRYWQEQESQSKEPDLIEYEKIVINLARLEERAGNLNKSIVYLQMALKNSPNPDAIRQQIAELKRKAAGTPAM